MKRITCFTSNLTGGGAEHQLTILSNLLAEKGYDVTIVTYNNIPDHYVLDKRIKRILLNVDGKNNIIKQLIISKFFFTHKTDCIISYRSVPNFILLLPLFITRKPKIIVSERNTTIVPSFREIINYNILYNRADHVVPNSHTQAKYLKGLNKKWKDRITTITNYTDVEEYSVKPVPKSTEVIKIGVFARLFPQKNYERFCFMLSAAIPQFVSLLLMRTMLKDNGLINNLLVQAGLISSPLPFLTNATWARATVVIINLWVGIPFTMMQVTGILQNIPGELYEAARVDGAGPVTIFFKITLPYMLFVTTPYLITTFTGNINNFNVIYLLTAGAPVPVGATAGKTDLLVTWLYKLTVDLQYFNVGAVVGILTFVILAVVSLITYRNTGSYKNEEGFQ